MQRNLITRFARNLLGWHVSQSDDFRPDTTDIGANSAAGLPDGTRQFWNAGTEPERSAIDQRSDGAVIGFREPVSRLVMQPEGASAFDEEIYLLCNPDVARTVEERQFGSGWEHWLAFGAGEEECGQRPTICNDEYYADVIAHAGPDYSSVVADFDADEYMYTYSDIACAFAGNAEACRHHWFVNGRSEGRYGPGARPFAGRRVSMPKVLEKPFGINIYGPFAATSGLGTAARGLLAAIRACGLPYEAHVFDVSRGLPRILPTAACRAGSYRVNLILVNADQIESLFRLYPLGYFDGYYNISVWGWELAAFRPDWYGCFGAVDEVWSYSEFACSSIGAIAPVPVHKVPLPIVATLAPVETSRDHFAIPRDKFVFTTMFDVGSTSARKNPMVVVKAFREAFSKSDDAFLLVKFHAAGYEPKLTRELSRAIAGLKNVLIIADRLCDRQMIALQSASDCLVSAHRSEGYGLNIAEFMALGKPVIATKYSGNLEFFDETTGYALDYKLVEIESQTGPYLPGYIWAEPNFESLIEQMKSVYTDRAEVRRRAAAAATRMKKFTPEAIGRLIEARLLDLGLDVLRPKFAEFLGRSSHVTNPSLFGTLSAETREELRKLNHKPRLTVIVPIFNVRPEYLRECIESVIAQTYPFWELCLCDDASSDPETVAALQAYRGRDARIKIRRLAANCGISAATNAAAVLGTGEFLILLDNDDGITPNALMEVARAVNADRSIDCVYSDEDKIDEKGQVIGHFMKPDWSPEHLESVMYVLHMLVVRKRLFLDLGGLRSEFDGAQDFDLMLRISRVTNKIHHITEVLYHWRAIPGSAAAVVDAKPYALEAGLRALANHVEVKYGERARAEQGLLPGTFRVRRALDEDVAVTLLILTHNCEVAIEERGLVRVVDNFVDSILAKTKYRTYEIVVVDNSRLDPEQTKRFGELGVRVENYTGRIVPFNYAEKANFAVSRARSEHIVLLNDDMEVISEEWLSALMEFAQDPDIGCVGARLLHAEGTIQHVGMVIGVKGGASHVYHSFPRDFIGDNGITHLVRNYSAVTGACFATRKSVLAQAGGFDPKFAIDYNDTDLCLRILECGYRIVYTPYASLYHFESVSAERHYPDQAEVARFTSKWRKYIDNDPYYNVNLSRDRIDYALRAR